MRSGEIYCYDVMRLVLTECRENLVLVRTNIVWEEGENYCMWWISSVKFAKHNLVNVWPFYWKIELCMNNPLKLEVPRLLHGSYQILWRFGWQSLAQNNIFLPKFSTLFCPLPVIGIVTISSDYIWIPLRLRVDIGESRVDGARHGFLRAMQLW